jgi:hypothetical protein
MGLLLKQWMSCLMQISRGNFDCMAEDKLPGQRCIVSPGRTRSEKDERTCVGMSCSVDGKLLVAGKPCDPGELSTRLTRNACTCVCSCIH